MAAIKKVKNETPPEQQAQVPSFLGDRPPGCHSTKNFTPIGEKRGYGKAKKGR